ncbi:M56 family metallopeptidase [Novosphingobium sp. KA1]|uniref:M56 family metallopeptidase n=1 Tax=Novosphingobium sp. (strain KA1) TaxID=164608 RepID=UPI001A8CA363|nr:M56 family metallopeptidase [Novosphingobium sp. KA1]QSR15792.1 hypothetical protein CA833_01015 [Novosphingobium sp. KA1]
MIEWLTDTLAMTALLMALILLARRPVARWFGPAAAYALWALPMIRLVLPPLALPRGLLPELSVDIEPITAAAGPALPPVATAVSQVSPQALPLAQPLASSQAVLTMAPGLAPDLAPDPATFDAGLLSHVPWGTVLLAVWLGGAVCFLASRIWNYQAMRRDILAEARVVARSGNIRIVESPAASAPLAFGVFDKVVALPRGFLASADSEASDFAIAHELQHHAGNDLLAIMALQPLFALHWFNPLGWAAWRALRADQEAACDARVMAGCGREMRARYGRLIASFAAGSRLTLAAPIAGALAGEKPIILRLKALAQADVSPARTVAARGLFALAIVSVPFTATVTYAAMDRPEVPDAPATPAPAIPAPAATAAPAIRAVDPDAPDLAPEFAALPVAPPVPAAHTAHAGPVPYAPAVPSSVPPMPPVPPAPPTPPAVRDWGDLGRSIARDVDVAVAQAMRSVPEVRETVSSDGKVQTIRIVREDQGGRSRIEQEMTLDSRCPADSRRSAARSSRGGRSEVTVICTGAPEQAMKEAAKAVASARDAVAANRHLSAEIRREIMSQLDDEMARARADLARKRAEAAASQDD